MKQFICTLIALAASAGLLFLVSAPVNNLHGEEGQEETHVESNAGEGEETADHGEAVTVHGETVDSAAH